MSEREEFEAAWSRLVGLPYTQALQRGVWDLDFMWDLWQAARSTPMAGAEPPKQGEALQTLRSIIASDSYAISFQTFGQYRTQLLKDIDALAAPSVEPAPGPQAAGDKMVIEMSIEEWQGKPVPDWWKARAAFAQAAPHQEPGWVRVPVEPTAEMMTAAEACSEDWPRTTWKKAWAAMLAAAPKEPKP